MQAVHQAVIGVRQGAVGRKTRRTIGLQQLLKARMFIHFEAPPQRVAAQAIDGHRHQPVSVQPEQRRRIAGQQGPHRFQQAAVTLAVGQFARQVIDQRYQDLQHRGGIHIDSLKHHYDYLMPVSF
jgi:hypothetical protein